jgi:hypothetical protein
MAVEEGAAARLARLQAGTTAEQALSLFDALPAPTVADMIGRWRGVGLPTGHPLDGLLEALGWHGKAFVDPETVHPLLFARSGAPPVALDPARLPVGLLVRWPGLTGAAVLRTPAVAAMFRAAWPLLRTRRPAARLRCLAWRGRVGAAMIYDRQPICDVFRTVDADTRLGLMDLRGLPAPFFFVLRREPDAVSRGSQPL